METSYLIMKQEWFKKLSYYYRAIRKVDAVKIRKAFSLMIRLQFRLLFIKIAFHFSQRRPCYPEITQPVFSRKLFQGLHDTDVDQHSQRESVDIIVPVYNGYDYLKPLFESILKNTKPPYRLIVIDDCSPDDRVLPLLEEYSEHFKHFVFLKNKKNLGFIGAVNRSVLHSNSKIFVLLNTDTEVPPDWLDRLIKPIRLDPKVASATPWSNSATICSFPNFLENNELFLGLSLQQIDAAFADIKLLEAPVNIPTGVGFCMAFRRSLVDEINLFDPIFGKGYGEENDWCMRAVKSGYYHVLVNNLFVYHKHGGSFVAEEKEALTRKNHELLLSRHPEYERLVHEHINLDPLKKIREFIKLKLASAVHGAVLIVCHNLGGGAHYYSKRLIDSYLEQGRVVVRYVDDSITQWVFAEVYIQDERFILSLAEFDFLGVLIEKINFIEVVYNNNVAASDALGAIKIICSLKERYKFNLTTLFHDFYPVCPSYCLVDSGGNYCGVPDELEKCKRCLPNIPSRFSAWIPKHADIQIWRDVWSKMLEKSDNIICFSDSSRSIVEKAYQTVSGKISVVPHEVDWIPSHIPASDFSLPMHIGVVGGINYVKGLDVVIDMVKYIRKNNKNIKVTVLGNVDAVLPINGLQVTGSYEKNALPGLIEKHGINLFFLPSIWPETFSYVTSELIVMKIPLACFDLGAPAERVSEYEFGRIIEMGDSEKILHQLEEFMNDLIYSHRNKKKSKIAKNLVEGF